MSKYNYTIEVLNKDRIRATGLRDMWKESIQGGRISQARKNMEYWKKRITELKSAIEVLRKA